MIFARGGVAALLIAGLALAACQSDADHFAQAKADQAAADAARVRANAEVVNLDPDTLMDAVCLIKLQHIETMTPAWTKFCRQRGFTGA